MEACHHLNANISMIHSCTLVSDSESSPSQHEHFMRMAGPTGSWLQTLGWSSVSAWLVALVQCGEQWLRTQTTMCRSMLCGVDSTLLRPSFSALCYSYSLPSSLVPAFTLWV